MQKTEILAPIGNREMLTAAVYAGVDAVYLGLDSFNARRNAENFTTESLKEAVEFCHVRGVKVYLTMNILISDKEMEEALEKTVAAARCGIDALIIADLGFAKEIHKVLPNMPLHASTQMTVHSPAALPALKKLGFSRVVISREMSKQEIKEFCLAAKKENIEVEAFVHGALCMSMSGQCLLSAMLGGRSGNRGLCAGPCRLPIDSPNGNDYALSLKDLSLVPFLKELNEMGVLSFKIEGRMKRPEYVAAAVSVCKTRLEDKENETTLKLLEDIFSRSGFTDGYYKNELGQNMFGIRTKDDVLSSAKSISAIHEIYRNEAQRVEINGKFTAKQGEDISLTATDGKNTVTKLGLPPEKAINRADDEINIKTRLSKTGGTPYFFKNLEVTLDDGLFIKPAILNSLRRDVLEELSALRAKVETPLVNDFSPLSQGFSKGEPKRVVRVENLSQITPKTLKADLLVVPLNLDFKELPKDTKIAVELPRGISNESVIETKLQKAKQEGINIAFCGTLAAKELAEKCGFNIIADFGFNTYNSYSLNYHKENGVKAAVLSPEVLISDAKRFSEVLPKGIITYGQMPLMLTRNCPVKKDSCVDCKGDKHLTDRKGISFPVICQNGYSVILNSRVIWLADKDRSGFDFEVIYFTTETPDRIEEVLSLYDKKAEADCEYTRGLYFRGVE